MGDFIRTSRKDGEDDVGDSDGDDGIEPETEADAESGRHVQLHSQTTVQRQPQSQHPQGSQVSASRPPRQPAVVRTALVTNNNTGDTRRSCLALNRQASAASDDDGHLSALQVAQQTRDLNARSCSRRGSRAYPTDLRPPKEERKQLICQSTRIWFEQEPDTNPVRSLSVGPTFNGSSRRGHCIGNWKPPEADLQAPCEGPMQLLVPFADCNSAWRRQAKRCCRSPRRPSHAVTPGSALSGSRQHRLRCGTATTPREFAVIRTQADATLRDTLDGRCMVEGFVKRNARRSSNPT